MGVSDRIKILTAKWKVFKFDHQIDRIEHQANVLRNRQRLSVSN